MVSSNTIFSPSRNSLGENLDFRAASTLNIHKLTVPLGYLPRKPYLCTVIQSPVVGFPVPQIHHYRPMSAQIEKANLSRHRRIGTTARHKARKTSQRLRTAINAPKCKNETGQDIHHLPAIPQADFKADFKRSESDSRIARVQIFMFMKLSTRSFKKVRKVLCHLREVQYLCTINIR